MPLPEPVPSPPGLYLLATPIGNMRDITLRALDVLAAADLVVCEDKRVTAKILQAYDLRTPMTVYNDHSAQKERGTLLEKLSGGARIALVTDAGTPLVSDPGYKLVRDCLDLGITVTSLPGANAPLTALQLSGLPSDKFCFLGFLPPRVSARRKTLSAWAGASGTLIIFETGPRLAASLADMLAVLGDRPAAVVREMTKRFEETRRGPLSQLSACYAEEGPPKGEIVVVVGAGPEKDYDSQALEDMLAVALERGLSVREAATDVASLTGHPRKDLYERALALRKDGQGNHDKKR